MEIKETCLLSPGAPPEPSGPPSDRDRSIEQSPQQLLAKTGLDSGLVAPNASNATLEKHIEMKDRNERQPAASQSRSPLALDKIRLYPSRPSDRLELEGRRRICNFSASNSLD